MSVDLSEHPEMSQDIAYNTKDIPLLHVSMLGHSRSHDRFTRDN